jgi:hypothetical protein
MGGQTQEARDLAAAIRVSLAPEHRDSSSTAPAAAAGAQLATGAAAAEFASAAAAGPRLSIDQILQQVQQMRGRMARRAPLSDDADRSLVQKLKSQLLRGCIGCSMQQQQQRQP